MTSGSIDTSTGGSASINSFLFRILCRIGTVGTGLVALVAGLLYAKQESLLYFPGGSYWWYSFCCACCAEWCGASCSLDTCWTLETPRALDECQVLPWLVWYQVLVPVFVLCILHDCCLAMKMWNWTFSRRKPFMFSFQFFNFCVITTRSLLPLIVTKTPSKFFYVFVTLTFNLYHGIHIFYIDLIIAFIFWCWHSSFNWLLLVEINGIPRRPASNPRQYRSPSEYGKS